MLIRGSGSGGGVVVDIRGVGGYCKREESPDFRFPEVNIPARGRGTFEF